MRTVPETPLVFINSNSLSGRASSLGGSVVSVAQGYFGSLFHTWTCESTIRNPCEGDWTATSDWALERTGKAELRQPICPRCSKNSRLVRSGGIRQTDTMNPTSRWRKGKGQRRKNSYIVCSFRLSPFALHLR